jgi:hypothetical protein
MGLFQQHLQQAATHKTQHQTLPTSSPTIQEMFYTGGALATLLLLYGLIGQVTRFVKACKE